MMIHSIYKSAVWLALGLGIVACASMAKPVEEHESPTRLPAGSSTSSPMATERVQPTQPVPTPSPAIILPDLGPAPDIANEVWLNTDQPLNLAALSGRVVVVEFWTFG